MIDQHHFPVGLKVFIWLILTILLSRRAYSSVRLAYKLHDVMIPFSKTSWVYIYIAVLCGVAVVFIDNKTAFLTVGLVGALPLFYADWLLWNWVSDQPTNTKYLDGVKPLSQNYRFWIVVVIAVLSSIYLITHFPERSLSSALQLISIATMIGMLIYLKRK